MKELLRDKWFLLVFACLLLSFFLPFGSGSTDSTNANEARINIYLFHDPIMAVLYTAFGFFLVILQTLKKGDLKMVVIVILHIVSGFISFKALGGLTTTIQDFQPHFGWLGSGSLFLVTFVAFNYKWLRRIISFSQFPDH